MRHYAAKMFYVEQFAAERRNKKMINNADLQILKVMLESTNGFNKRAASNAIEIIERLNAENERLLQELQQAQAENERLQCDLEQTEDAFKKIYAMNEAYKKTIDKYNGEAIKQFANRKCGNCIFAKPTTFGRSKNYVECTNREHVQQFCKRKISAIRQRTNPACRSFKSK